MAGRPVRESRPTTLAAWRLINSRSPDTNIENANIGFELAGRDIPKYKFLYTVSFEFGEHLAQSMRTHGGGWTNNLASNSFPCKNVTRPNVNVSYVDVNSYNYRYKVATKVDYGTVTITAYDDNKNTVHRMVTSYLDAISPIMGKESGSSYYMKDSMQDWASLGPLPHEEVDGIIRTMRVYHHVNANNSDLTTDRKWVAYDYINPKLQLISMDELDMSVSDVSTISLTFVYDSVYIHNNFDTRQGNVTTSEEWL